MCEMRTIEFLQSIGGKILVINVNYFEVAQKEIIVQPKGSTCFSIIKDTSQISGTKNKLLTLKKDLNMRHLHLLYEIKFIAVQWLGMSGKGGLTKDAFLPLK